jgi:hypothetical protein
MENFNPKLRQRLTRVRGNITGNEYGYHPINHITKIEELEEGSRVRVIGKPQGKGIKSVVLVKYRNEEYTVFVKDLTIIVKGK